MRRNLDSVNTLSLMLCLLLLVSCSQKQSEHDHSSHISTGEKYICPMRCEGEKTYAEPGNCPVCNMKLELVADDLVQTSPPNQQVLSRQATTKLQQGNGDKTFTAPGYIVPAQNRNRSIAARFGGRLDKL